MSDLQFRVLTEDEAQVLETTSHNPPAFSAAFTADDFRQEWWSVHERLKALLELFGEPWTPECQTGDFMLPKSSGPDRWIYITFCSARLWRPEFVAAVADFLRHLPQDYRIACLTELSDDADPGFEEPFIYLVISANSVEGNAALRRLDSGGKVISRFANDVLARFGFPQTILSNDATQAAKPCAAAELAVAR